MKDLTSILIGFLFALTFVSESFSQDTISLDTTKKSIQLKSVYLTYGKGALSSGADMTLNFSWDKDKILFLKANNDRAIVNIGKAFGNFQTILSVGIYKNIPWAGPMLIYKYKFLSFTSWNGIAFGKDTELTAPGVTPRFFFSYQGVDITFGKNSLGYAFMYFTIKPINHFGIYKRAIPISKQALFTFEATYNYQEHVPMFVVGYKHVFFVSK